MRTIKARELSVAHEVMEPVGKRHEAMKVCEVVQTDGLVRARVRAGGSIEQRSYTAVEEVTVR